MVIAGNDSAALGSWSYSAFRRISIFMAACTQAFSSGVSGVSVAFRSSFLASSRLPNSETRLPSLFTGPV